MIDIRSDSTDKRAVRLSNFTRRSFVYEHISCNSLEGFLQSLKTDDIETQQKICLLTGMAAKRAGQIYDKRREEFLYWKEDHLPRNGKEYFELLTEAYTAAYEQDPTFQEDLLATGHEELRHSVGKHDCESTILTETEFLYQIYRLRALAHRVPAAQLALPGLRA